MKAIIFLVLNLFALDIAAQTNASQQCIRGVMVRQRNKSPWGYKGGLSNVHIEIFPAKHLWDWDTDNLEPLKEVYTNCWGEYEVGALDTGYYNIVATVDGYYPLSIGVVHLTSNYKALMITSFRQDRSETYVSSRREHVPFESYKGPYEVNQVGSSSCVMIHKMGMTFSYPGHYVVTRKGIEHSSFVNINDAMSGAAGVYQQMRGDDLHIYGSR